MLTNSSNLNIQRTLSRLLFKHHVQVRDRDEIALGIIEFIALRLPEPLDCHVFTMGLYVRRQLDLLARGEAREIEVAEKLTVVALAARQGLCVFLKSVDLDRT